MKNIKLEILKEINKNLNNKPNSKDSINEIIDEMILLSRNSEKTRELAELKELLKSKSDHEVVDVFQNLILELKSTPSLGVKNTFLNFALIPPPEIKRAESTPILPSQQDSAKLLHLR